MVTPVLWIGCASQGGEMITLLPDDLAPVGDGLGTQDGGGTMTSHANVQLSAVGCSPMLTGDVLVIARSSAVSIVQRLDPLHGTLTVDLDTTGQSIAVATANSLTNKNLIEVVDETTYLNSSLEVPDPISGTIDVNLYDETAGIVDLVFKDVRLESNAKMFCTISGTVVTDGKDY